MTYREPSGQEFQAQRKRFARLSAIVKGMAHKMRPADEDMVQTGLCKLWEVIVTGGVHEDKYLIAAARNAMIDRIRYQKSRDRVEKLTDFLQIGEPTQPDDGGDEALSVDVLDLLALLPKHVARAFRLHVFSEYTLAETAKIMNRPVGTVASWIRRAQAIIRKELE